ncbi:MAG: heavy metal translocating P-type ATPase, partial [Candidatus Korobacteraceae bacterium]
TGQATASEIQRAIKETGMVARPQGALVPEVTFWAKYGRLLMAAVSAATLGLAGVFTLLAAPEMWIDALLGISLVTGGWFIAPRGFRAARGGILDMNFLMSIAAMGAVFIHELGEAASAMFLFSVAQLLEAHSMDRARSAIKALMDLSPSEATVKQPDGNEKVLPVQDVGIGDVVIVRPGQKIPLDGVIVEGESAVDQAPITGESIPVDKAAGADVFAGSMNQQGLLEIRVTKLVEDTTLARIIHSVEEAQATRAPSQSFVDHFSHIYTPSVVAVAVLIAVLPPAVGFGTWGGWLYRALTMLVIACPCALVISTPVSIVSGLAAAARGGVLIKGGIHLENAGRVDAIAFDKTGTLTKGTPVVTDIEALNGIPASEVLRLAAAVERGSEHPLARAVISASEANKLEIPKAIGFEAIVGRGAQARVNGNLLYVGSERLVHELGICTPQSEALQHNFESQGKTALILASEAGPLGVIAVADAVRPEAREAIGQLKSIGVRKLLMLTGDNELTARSIAMQTGISEHYAGLLPHEKVAIVRKLEEQGHKIAFVGDGVNDAPALASATVGIAMGAAGTDVALETADLALMGDDLSKLAFAVRLSRKTLAVIRQNLAFSIAVKVLFLVLALTGMATLWMAVAADMGASLAVIANGLRVLRMR